jgi:chromosome partitioning protein
MKYLTTRGFAVCPYSLGYRVAFEDADEDGQTPQEIEPQGKAAAEIQSVYRYTIEALHHLTNEGVNHGKELGRTVA